MRTETIAVHGDPAAPHACRSVATPIFQTAAYSFDSAEHAAALFDLEEEGFRYSRISNPTTSLLETRMALLEGGVDAVVTSSGQAALHYAVMNLVEPGRNIVSTPHIYGTTHTLFTHFLPSLGVEVRLAASSDPADLAELINENTRALFCETVGNPSGHIADIEALARVAHAAHMPLVVDNTLATPMLHRPIDWGADIVVHSLTKFVGGHGSTLGGAIIDGGTFDWALHPTRFPMFSRCDKSYHGLVYVDHFGPKAFAARCRSLYLRVTGAALSPLSAFLLLQGAETLAVRMDRHVENARSVAHFLRSHPNVAWVNYGGFPENRLYASTQKYLRGRPCSVFSFGIRGGLPAATRFYNALSLVKRVVNLGDVRSLACHPASTTHRQMSADQQRAAGIFPEMVRLSIGIEHVEDIVADLDQALGACIVSVADMDALV